MKIFFGVNYTNKKRYELNNYKFNNFGVNIYSLFNKKKRKKNIFYNNIRC